MAFRPKKLFRIADSRHPLFDGTGAFLAGARWNSPGRRIIYMADSFAAAMLEILVHTAIGRLPSSHKWIEVAVPPSVSVEFADTNAILGWRDEASLTACKAGDLWFDSQESLLLVVPSLFTNGLSQNILINQNHPEFPMLQATPPQDITWDSRLFV